MIWGCPYFRKPPCGSLVVSIIACSIPVVQNVDPHCPKRTVRWCPRAIPWPQAQASQRDRWTTSPPGSSPWPAASTHAEPWPEEISRFHRTKIWLISWWFHGFHVVISEDLKGSNLIWEVCWPTWLGYFWNVSLDQTNNRYGKTRVSLGDCQTMVDFPTLWTLLKGGINNRVLDKVGSPQNVNKIGNIQNQHANAE